MFFIKKLRKNKVFVLAACVIVVSIVYTGVQKAIDDYNFETNSDIVWEEDDRAVEEGESESEVSNEADDEVEIPSEETDLVLEEISEEIATDGSEEEGIADGESDAQSQIYVYITGEVNSPGVVVLNEGSRIVDAINAAGGTTTKANISKVNLVYVLDDGMKVNIPNDNDLKKNPNFEYITMNSGDGASDDYSGSDVAEVGGTNGSSKDSSGSGSFTSYSIVNINTATQTELETLPGIGPSLALNIINYRKENGKFSSIEQIKEVSGIGESKFESLKSYITI